MLMTHIHTNTHTCTNQVISPKRAAKNDTPKEMYFLARIFQNSNNISVVTKHNGTNYSGIILELKLQIRVLKN